MQTQSQQRVDTPPPPIPERNPTRPGYTLRIQQIQQEHQLEQERQLQEDSPVSQQESSDFPQPQLEHRRRATSPSDAEVSKFLRETRPGHQRRETSPDNRRDNPTVHELGSRRVFPAIHQGLHHPQPRRVHLNMAGTRRTGYLDVAAASTQRITPHQMFLKGQVKRQQDATDEWARRTGKSAPPYQFEDFIGKGAYGRVFRAVHKVSQQQFAIKVMDADAVDIRANAKFRDESIKEFMHETKVLKKLAGAPNVNQIFDVMEVEAQLWIISEYVPGGSVKTLMQSTGGKLDESYILVIAREVAKGLQAIHNSGIIHRDLKAANIMVHEEGRVQIIDFGVSGLMETKADRRGTIIGTFNWMAPELLKHAKGQLGDDRQAPDGTKFGIEIDVWSYGCTLFEMARGRPPNAGLMGARQIESMLKRNNPRLKPEDGFSQRLCDMVACVLELKPERRPSMDDVLRHPYIHETEKTHPTTILRQLIRVYEDWASSGGQRQSLIQPSGAAAAEFPEDPKDLGNWRFSVVNIGESAYDNVDNAIPSFHLDPAMDPAMDLELAQREENNLNSLIPESSYTPFTSPRLPSNLADHPDDGIDPTQAITMKTTASEESRIRGVGARFADFFEGGGYSGSEATRPRSDLLLRNDTSESDASQKENNKKKSNFRGTPVDTARANQTEQNDEKPVEQPIDRDARRGTLLQTWDFESASRTAQEPQHELEQGPDRMLPWDQNFRIPDNSFDDLGAPDDDVEVAGDHFGFPGRPALHHYATAPVEPPMLHNNINTATSRQTLDLDALMDEGPYSYNAPPPSQQYSYDAPSSHQSNAPNPYQSYANTAGPAAMIDTHDYGYNAPTPRNDYHIDAISPTTRAGPEDDQSQYATIAGHPATNGASTYEHTARARGTYNGLTHTPTDSFNGSTPDETARPSPPSAAAMAGDAPVEVMEGELRRLTLAWEQGLRSAAEIWGDDSADETDTDGEDEGGDYAGLDDN